jgi:peptide/nickel transport system permease protein
MSIDTVVPSTSPTVEPRPGVLRRLVRNPVAIVGAIMAFGMLVFAFVAPLFDHGTSVSVDTLLAPGSDGHPLGTDSAGDDVLIRLFAASRTSIFAAALSLLVALILGVTAGLVAGYRGRAFGVVSGWIVGLLMALPHIVVLLAVRAVLGSSIWLSMALFGVMMSPSFFHLVSSSVNAIRAELFVDAARISGVRDSSIVFRHILALVRGRIIALAANVMSIAIAFQSALEFLGIGDMNTSTWGAMLNDGFLALYQDPILMLWPALAIGITTIGLTIFADALRDELSSSVIKPPSRRVRQQRIDLKAAQIEPTVHAESAAKSSQFGDEILAVRDLHVGYVGNSDRVAHVVRGVSLTVRKGEVHGLIGESGSGKSQTAFSILGLLSLGGRVLGGDVRFDGAPLEYGDAATYEKIRGERIGYIPQEPLNNLDPTFTIGYQLVEPLRRTNRLSKEVAKRKVIDLLATVGVPDPERTFRSYPHEISGGMAQRALIAGAVASDPELLIADEPTTALDVTVQADVLDLLHDLVEARDLGVLIVTHNFGVVADLCDTVSVMQQGRIVESGPVSEVFGNPQHEYTRSLLNAVLDDAPPREPRSKSLKKEGIVR